MERTYVPIRKFYEKYLPAAKANGYRYVVCLLARDTGIDALYETVKKQWTAIDDVTDKDFLFLFAGRQDLNTETGITYSGWKLAYNDYIQTFNQTPRIEWGSDYDFCGREDRAIYTDDLREAQTKQISELQQYFGLSRRDIPCLMFTNLHTGKNTRVAFTDKNLYALIDGLLCDLEKLFAVIDELKEKIAEYDKLRSSKSYNQHTDMKNLRAELTRVADILLPKHKEALLDCMENLTFGDGIVDDFFCKKLNAYVGLAKALKDTDTKPFDYIVENNEPQHSQDNLKRLYKRADEIIHTESERHA
ncbi:hypothetical protein FACS189499_09630 [Clostridia bacterium]|nr:hypothetical protein FACS189499_09630 [Clostridia bacterium]